MPVEPAQDSRLTRRDLDGVFLANRLEASEVESASVGFKDFGFRRQRRSPTAEGVDPRQELATREGAGPSTPIHVVLGPANPPPTV